MEGLGAAHSVAVVPAAGTRRVRGTDSARHLHRVAELVEERTVDTSAVQTRPETVPVRTHPAPLPNLVTTVAALMPKGIRVPMLPGLQTIPARPGLPRHMPAHCRPVQRQVAWQVQLRMVLSSVPECLQASWVAVRVVVPQVESVPAASGLSEPEVALSGLAAPAAPAASPVADVGESTELAVLRRRARRAVGARWVASVAWHREADKDTTKTPFTTPPATSSRSRTATP